ncbi:MAG: SMC-Scp complex subunit ScpB [Microscillaceae bacterium]|nr:SMC-Scp complex subunit ScpB [Microscillaceae bacterium]
MKFLENHIEALIFCAAEPIKAREIEACLSELLATEVPSQDIESVIITLQAKYASDDYAFQIYALAGGYQFQTKPDFHASVGILLKHQSKKQLSKATLEALAIIAYKQPVTKTEVEHIRGVNSDYAIQKLLDKELIVIKGKADTPGKPVLYGTSPKFMEYFGINSLDQLPQPKDFAEEASTKIDTSEG